MSRDPSRQIMLDQPSVPYQHRFTKSKFLEVLSTGENLEHKRTEQFLALIGILHQSKNSNLPSNQLVSTLHGDIFPKSAQHSKVWVLLNLREGLQFKKRVSQLEEILVLAGVAQWIECGLLTEGSLVRFPVKAYA